MKRSRLPARALWRGSARGVPALGLLLLPGCLLFSGFLSPRCGDGAADLDRGEACDDGNDIDADGCEADCSLPACGNGIRDPGEACFNAQSNFTAGAGALSLAIADLNGDGLLDIATANFDSDDVSVLLGQGGAQFLAEARFPVGFVPFGITAGDFNGDGAPDLATANNGSDDVSLLLGDGQGRFAEPVDAAGAPVRFAVGFTPELLAAGDLDGDGLLDIAVSNLESDSVSVLFGDVGQLLSPQSELPAGGGPNDVALADIDADGDLDLISVNAFSDDLEVFFNLGGRALSGGLRLPVGDVPNAAVAADFDSDGALDLAVANTGSGDVSAIAGLGGGAFAAEEALRVGRAPLPLAAGDIDGDGSTDLVVGNETDETLSVLLNDGLGSFAAAPALELGAGGALGSGDALAVVDLNGDGAPEIALARDGLVTVFFAQP